MDAIKKYENDIQYMNDTIARLEKENTKNIEEEKMDKYIEVQALLYTAKLSKQLLQESVDRYREEYEETERLKQRMNEIHEKLQEIKQQMRAK
jgi:tRNA A-37 threonylcarbamoyl transferase component Bud32